MTNFSRVPGRALTLLLAASLTLLCTATAAWAFWSGGGAASSTVATATLGAPSGVNAAAGGGTVTVSWTAPSVRPAGAAPRYRVVETSSGTAVCGGATPVTATSCTWTPGTTGSYRFTVTAVLRTWTATSAASNQVTLGATGLALTSAPVSGTAAGSAALGPLTVGLRDAAGNATTAATATTVTLTSSSAGARFATTRNGQAVTSVTIPAGSGTASFFYGDTRAGSPTVTVTAAGLTSATQVETIQAASPSTLAFGQQPGTATAGSKLTPAPTVLVLDDFGNQTTSSITVAVTLSGGPSGASLNGTRTATAVNGVATFPNLSLTGAGTGYTLTASRSLFGGFVTDTSDAFTVVAAQPDSIAITSSAVSAPASSTATLGPVTVQLQDAYGNPTPAAAATTVTLASNSAGTKSFARTSGGTPTTTVTIAAGSSTATFWYGDTRAGSPTITVTAAGLGSDTQTETVSAAAVATLSFTTQPPASVAKGRTFGVTVRALDQFGNAASATVALTLDNPGGVNGANLQGDSSNPTVSGTATFSGLSVNKAGTFSVTARAGTVSLTSTAFVQN